MGKMGKRFTDTYKWTRNKWFRKLNNSEKLLWLYILDTCDAVGVWENDLEFASMLIGIEFDEGNILSILGDRIHVFDDRQKWWIIDFCNYQYGELKEENINNKPHQSYISLLKKHSLWIDYTRTIHSHKEKDKDKAKDKEKKKDKSLKSVEQNIDKFKSDFPDVDVEFEFEKFKDDLKKKGKTWKDYHAAFRNWLKTDWVKKKEPEEPESNGVEMICPKCDRTHTVPEKVVDKASCVICKINLKKV